MRRLRRHSYDTPGTYLARLRVTDQRGAEDVSDAITISADNTPPAAIIDTPTSALTWKVNDTIVFSGHATDDQEGTLPDTQLDWTILLHHCPSTCHAHTYQTYSEAASGSFPAPDHDYPSHLEIRLTATDTQGLTHTSSALLQPQTSTLTFQTTPAGLQLEVGASTSTTPFTRTVIVGSMNSVEAVAPQGSFPNVWDFASWSDGGAQTHNITAPAAPTTYTAAYATRADLSLAATGSPEPAGAGADHHVHAERLERRPLAGQHGLRHRHSSGRHDLRLGGRRRLVLRRKRARDVHDAVARDRGGRASRDQRDRSPERRADRQQRSP